MLVDDLIKIFNLEELPEEGGYYRRSYVAEDSIELDRGKRNLGDAIYYLITKDQFSKLHKLKCDELWHFYAGDPVEMIQVNDNEIKKIELGNKDFNIHVPQLLVPKNIWQGTKLKEGGSWALLGTSAFPAYDHEDFSMQAADKFAETFNDEDMSIIGQYL